MISVEIDRVYKRFQNEWIIKDFSHSFEKGSITGVSGRNGSGKTTLIRIIAGLLVPSKGKVSYHLDSKSLKEHEWYKYLSYSAPYIVLNEELTAVETFNFVSKLKPYSDMQSDKFLKISYLDRDFDKQIKNYSSGMKQRLSLALSLLNDCPLLILDEPTSYLDLEAKNWFYNLLDKRKSNKTIILASNEAGDFGSCDKVLNIKV